MENIKIQSTAYPEQRLSLEQWRAEFKVGIRHSTSKFTDRAQQMMSLWDAQTLSNYVKRLKVG